MPNIKITVAGKIATNTTPDVVIICGNSDYTVTFDLDEEWAAQPVKTARFTYVRDGKRYYKEKLLQGNTVKVPMLSTIRRVEVGLYAADLYTSTPAVVLCLLSARCGDAEEQITQSEKAGLKAQVDELGQRMDDLELGAPPVLPGVEIIEPEKYYQYGTVDALAVTLAEKTDGKAHEYMIEFTPAVDFRGLTITPAPAWVREPQYPAGKRCVVSIMQGLAVMGCG